MCPRQTDDPDNIKARREYSHDIAGLPGVGDKTAAKLRRIGIETVSELLFTLPYRYQDRTRLTPIQDVLPGRPVCVLGDIETVQIIPGRRRMLLCRLNEHGRRLSIRLFHFSQAQKQTLQQAKQMLCFGEARAGRQGLELVHPQYRLFNHKQNDIKLEETLTPIYPAQEGFTQPGWRRLTRLALQYLSEHRVAQELIPTNLPQFRQLPPLQEALCYLHRPPPEADIALLLTGKHPCQRRLAWEELLAHRLSLRRARQRARQHRAMAHRSDKTLVDRFVDKLPFSLTSAQKRVGEEIIADLGQAQPMMRLLQGDVGSGKTVVAAVAALVAIADGCQVALMTPTELLAEQHAANFNRWLTPLNISSVFVSGSLSAKDKRDALAQIAAGEAQLVIGTHALFQQAVRFHKLSLAIIDEQHRFGVHQRLALKAKGMAQDCHPHQLIMTATPIPRTLTMSAYADLDVSVLNELPPGRKPTQTAVISDRRRSEVIEKIRLECLRGRQAYWVCTLIEESESRQDQAAEAVSTELKKQLPQLNIALLHGRMKAAEKENIMSAFRGGDTHLLVATTVIEVGVDVSNAGLMIIENAERLGLSQLHQLRGRVGRGGDIGHCLLLYRAPLSENGAKRLAVMRDCHDGFKIAEQDLQIRGPGEILGTKQAGIARMRIAQLLRDRDLLADVKRIADEMMSRHPERVQPLIDRWLPRGQIDYVGV